MSEDKNKPTIAEELPLQEPEKVETDQQTEADKVKQRLRDRAKKAKEADKESGLVEAKDAATEPESKVIKGDVIIEGRLVVRSVDKRSQIAICPMEDCAGIWINSEPEGDKYPKSTVAIYDDKNQGPVIGFYKDTGLTGLALTVAIAMGETGPCIQVEDGRGGYGWIGLHELLDKHKPEWRQGQQSA